MAFAHVITINEGGNEGVDWVVVVVAVIKSFLPLSPMLLPLFHHPPMYHQRPETIDQYP